MPTININGSDLYYIELGNGEIPIIFGHNLFGSSFMWSSFYLQSLSPQFRGYALDFRGHGRSAEAKGCTVRNMADDVYEFAKHLKLGKFVYVGVSMGGGVGLQVALKHPEVLSALVLFSPLTGLGTSGSLLLRVMGSFFAKKRWILRPALSGMCVKKPKKEVMERLLDEAMIVSTASCKEFFSDTKPVDNVDRLENLSVPTLVVIGEKDTAVPIVEQKELVNRIPGAKMVIRPEGGHMVCFEEKETVFKEAMQFLDVVLAAGKTE